MDSKTLSQLERNINAERIAAVISHPAAHGFKKHSDEFNNDVTAFRQAIVDTLMDPETLVTKSSIGYVFFRRGDRPEDNVVVLIDPASPDWGTAFRPNGERGMKFLREKGVPINRNADANYLNKMNPGFFAQQIRYVPSPVSLNGLTREQTSEVMLSLFDRMDSAERSDALKNSFDVSRANIMPDMIKRMREFSPEQKEVLRTSAHHYKQSTRSQFEALSDIDPKLLPKDMKSGAVASMLRDPGQGPAFLAGLEERFAMAESEKDIGRLSRAIEACETFNTCETIRRDALEKTGEVMDRLRPQLKPEFGRVSVQATPAHGAAPAAQASRDQSA
jgi:hypothetical protein